MHSPVASNNASRLFDLDTKQKASFWMELTAYPVLLAASTVGNILLVKVSSSTSPRRNTSVFLTTMAVSGLIILWLELPIFTLTFLMGTDIQLPMDCLTTSALWFYLGLYKWGNCCFINLADWALILFAISWIAKTIFPSMEFSLFWTKASIAIMSMLAAFLAAENAVGHYYRDNHDRNATVVYVPEWLEKWDLVQNEAVVAVVYFRYVTVVLVGIIILCLLRCRPATIPKTLQSTMAAHRDHTGTFPPSRIMFSALLLYIITQFPTVLYHTLERWRGFCFSDSPEDAAWRIMLLRFSYVVSLINYSIGFFIFWTINTTFRKAVTKILKKAPKDTVPPVTGSSFVNSFDSDENSVSHYSLYNVANLNDTNKISVL